MKLNEMHNVENELLLQCSRTCLSEVAVQRIKKLVSEKINWNDIILTANRHGVLPLMFYSLNQVCPCDVPPSVFNRLRRHFSTNGLHNRLLANQLAHILELFSIQGIPAIPFKGPVLASLAYGNLTLRQMGDLDILVHEQDYDRAVALLLLDRDYKKTVKVPWETHLVSSDSTHSLDLHRDIVPQHLFCFDGSGMLWNHLRNVEFNGVQINILSPEMELLVACLNGNKECWQKLNRICDVAELIRSHPDMQWQWLMGYVHGIGCQRLFLLGLQLAKTLLEIPLPPTIDQSIQSDKTITTLTIYVSQRLFVDNLPEPGEVQRTIFHIQSRERLRDKFRSWIGLMNHSGWLTPTQNDRNFIDLPPRLAFLYFFLRPLRVINKYFLNRV